MRYGDISDTLIRRNPTLGPAETLRASLVADETMARGQKPLYIHEDGSILSIRFLEKKELDAPAAHLLCG